MSAIAMKAIVNHEYGSPTTLELQEIYRVFVKANLPNPYRDWIEAKQGHDACGEERLLLWHGTPLDSLLGILDLGLQIRRRGASWTGTMFGNGIYLADVSSKSVGYCKHRLWDGEAVLLLCEADVGKTRIQSQKSMREAKQAMLRTFMETTIARVAKAVFAERGYQQATLEEIAQRAGMSKATIYLYFKNKDDLFLHVVEELVETAITETAQAAEVPGTPLEKLARMLSWRLGSFFRNVEVPPAIKRRRRTSRRFTFIK